MSYRYVPNANSNAVIRTRIDRNGKTRTETKGRNSGINAAVSTGPNGGTRFFIDGLALCSSIDDRIDYSRSSASVALSGAEARTLYRVLQKHFVDTGKSF